MRNWILVMVFVFFTNATLGQNNTNPYPTTGNLGLGTNDPKAKLHLSYSNMTEYLNNVPFDALLMIGGHNNQFTGQFINFKNPCANGAEGISWWSADILFGRDKNLAKWSFKENHGDGLGHSVKDIIYAQLEDAGGYTNLRKLILAPDGGQVGIGTAAPSSLLQVHNVNVPANTVGAVLEIANFSAAASTPGNQTNFKFLMNRHTTGNTDWANVGSRLQFSTDITNQGYVEFNPKGDHHGIAIGSSTTEFMRFKTNGNIGIGTTTPGPYKLAVEGTLGARKVKVTQVVPWADYVFGKDYQLPSLAEVEKYIQQHKHLPDVPSAAEIEKNGLDLGDNQAVLLKKIEELTLYIIEQNKKLQDQENRLKLLQTDVKKLQRNDK